MLGFKKLTKNEMKSIAASLDKGGTSNSGYTTCGTEPDPINEPVWYQYWKDCMESNRRPSICPPGQIDTNQ